MTSQTILLARLALLTSEPQPSVARLRASLCRATVKPVKALLASLLQTHSGFWTSFINCSICYV